MLNVRCIHTYAECNIVSAPACVCVCYIYIYIYTHVCVYICMYTYAEDVCIHLLNVT